MPLQSIFGLVYELNSLGLVLFLAFTLWVFAFFHRFHILALGHLVALCIEPSLGVLVFCWSSRIFGYSLALVQWLLRFLLRYSSDLLLFHLDSTWLHFGPRSHVSLRSLEFFLVLKECLGIQGSNCACIEWSLYFYSFLSFLKICLVHLAIKKETNNLFCFALVNGN